MSERRHVDGDNEYNRQAPAEGGTARFHLRLFVTRGGPYSATTLAAVHEACSRAFGEDYRLEVIDVMEQPEAARQYNIFVTPMLLRVAPTPETRISGVLTPEEISRRLGLSGREGC